MPYDYSSIMQAQAERIAAEHAQAVAELEAARYNEDPVGVNVAADRILELDGKLEKLERRANQFVARQQTGPIIPGGDDLPRRDLDLCRKYGVSPNELGIAKGWTSDPKMTDESKVAQYVQNRARLQHERASGAYRDDQGSLKRG